MPLQTYATDKPLTTSLHDTGEGLVPTVTKNVTFQPGELAGRLVVNLAAFPQAYKTLTFCLRLYVALLNVFHQLTVHHTFPTFGPATRYQCRRGFLWFLLFLFTVEWVGIALLLLLLMLWWLLRGASQAHAHTFLGDDRLWSRVSGP